jgi:hypothetical protein
MYGQRVAVAAPVRSQGQLSLALSPISIGLRFTLVMLGLIYVRIKTDSGARCRSLLIFAHEAGMKLRFAWRIDQFNAHRIAGREKWAASTQRRARNYFALSLSTTANL